MKEGLFFSGTLSGISLGSSSEITFTASALILLMAFNINRSEDGCGFVFLEAILCRVLLPGPLSPIARLNSPSIFRQLQEECSPMKRLSSTTDSLAIIRGSLEGLAGELTLVSGVWESYSCKGCAFTRRG